MATRPLPQVGVAAGGMVAGNPGGGDGEGRHRIVFVINTNSGLAERVTSLIGARFGRNTAVMLNARSVRAGDPHGLDRQGGRRPRPSRAGREPGSGRDGLNNLVYFSTAIWFQNPNLLVGDVYLWPTAASTGRDSGVGKCGLRAILRTTTQEAQFTLGHKIAAARQADGLDVTSACLLAAGAAESDGAHAMSVGQALYRMLRKDRSPLTVTDSPRTAVAHARGGAFSTPAAQPMPTKPARQMSLFGGNTIDI